MACHLELPSHWKLHLVFHVSLLKTYHRFGRYQPPPVLIEIEGALEYEVEQVLEFTVGALWVGLRARSVSF